MTVVSRVFGALLLLLLASARGILVAKTVVAAEESDRVGIEPMVDYGTGRAGLGLRVRF